MTRSKYAVLEVLAADIHSEDVSQLAQRPEVASIAIDATVL